MRQYKYPILRADLDNKLSSDTDDSSELRRHHQYTTANPGGRPVTSGNRHWFRGQEAAANSDIPVPVPLEEIGEEEHNDTPPEELDLVQEKAREDAGIRSWPGAREELDWARDGISKAEEIMSSSRPYEDLDGPQDIIEGDEDSMPWAGPYEESDWVLNKAAEEESVPRPGPAQGANPVSVAESEPSGITYPDHQWLSRLSKTKDDQIHNVLGNVIRLLRFAPRWHRVFKYDIFSDTVLLAKSVPHLPGFVLNHPISDREIALVTTELLDDGLRCSSKLVAEAIATVAKDHSFHPVRTYLESLEHDGISRVSTWLSTYCGAEDSVYTRAVGSRWLISAVARVYQPGCKADCCLIFEGDQGTGKSTTFKTLGGEWYSDSVPDLGTKDSFISIRSSWIVELSELAALNRREASEIKAFMSKSSDKYRPVYGRSSIDCPRQCVFAGTTNHSVYFNDETGQRRFWPVETGVINTEALKRDRDQIWAEAVTLYKVGHL